ncbi:hypothetical protein EDD18DRAFT_1361223 [Armillaria luteobubalina]|uniref:Uncharacterized protein n=1 Tax=Armillaria luteobubalina TaxID=153913 RepID=A0AA39PK27_9AGAR|nr:hypothetical protein EDD18DRAFT_1361223 [Armillaria luteobubalina]
MDELWEKYTSVTQVKDAATEENLDSKSMEYRVKYYEEYELQVLDIIALEYDQFSIHPKYALQPQMLETIQGTINELQAALTIAATLVPSQSNWYWVDPNDMFMKVLKGINNVKLLNAAWRGLAGRLRRVH